MNLHNEVLLPCDRQTVFDALHDIDILQRSIPGCESLERVAENELEATITVKFGPVKATFVSKVSLDGSGGPEKFLLSGSGDAGAMGSATGKADVTLSEQEQGAQTLLHYEVTIDVVGKLAQIGSRLMEGTTKKLARNFFSNFENALSGDDDGGQKKSENASAPA